MGGIIVKKIIIGTVIVLITLVTVYIVSCNTAEVQNIPEIERNVVESVATLPVVESVEKQPIKRSQTPTDEWVSLGTYKVTAYCGENYPHICNDGDATKTATGTTPKANHTIAVDPRNIPYGSKVKIGDVVYTAEDCGGAIKQKRVDIFFNTHQEALNFGTQYREVFILRSVTNA